MEKIEGQSVYVKLTDKQVKELARIAKETGTPRASLIREGISYVVMQYKVRLQLEEETETKAEAS